jgi:ferredoxin
LSSRPAGPSAGGAAGPPRAAVVLSRLIAQIDRLFDRIYGARWSPLHQSGNLAILCFAVTLVTGIYLFLFYKIADPHGSVTAIQDRVFLGAWTRSLHRYSADLAIVAIVVHIVRKLVQGHTWGPRALAWVSGVALLGVVLFCGWTGLILVWDTQAQRIAIEGTRVVDLLPVLSEPISRMFSGIQPVPSSFFFMNLFLHVALPLGIATMLAVHVTRVARPALLPPRATRNTVLAALIVLSLVWPVALPPAADLRALPAEVPTDLLYAFWLPVARQLSPLAHLATWVLAAGALASLAWWWRPRRGISPSRVDEDSCSGCTNCYQDCPYEAIAMVRRTRESRQTSEFVARVDPSLCVGCGICAASCAPMGVGPAGRTGRDQWTAAAAFADAVGPSGHPVAIVACGNGVAEASTLLSGAGRHFFDSGCSGSVHTSVVELLLRRGFAGVFLLTCPPRNCFFREGPKWLAARVFDGREAELQSRVDRRRVAIESFSPAFTAALRARLAEFERQVAALDIRSEDQVELDAQCDLDAARRVLAEVANA